MMDDSRVILQPSLVKSQLPTSINLTQQVLMRLCQQRGIAESDLGLTVPLGTPIQMPVIAQYSSQDLDGEE
jgi:hypothetical protein